MQANWDEKYLTHVGHFSHIIHGQTVSHSDKTYHLVEISKLYIAINSHCKL